MNGMLSMRSNARKLVAAALLLSSVQGVALAATPDSVSALIETGSVQHTEMHATVSGYGLVVPAPGAVLTLNFPIAGVVRQLWVTPGQRVKRGMTLLEIGAAPQAQLARSQAEHAVEYAKGQLARVKALFAEQLATRSQVAAARRGLKDAQAALRASRNAGKGVRHNKLVAPFDGTVASIAVAPGDRFQAGAQVMQLLRAGGTEVQLGIEPEDSRLVTPGLKVVLTPILGHGEAIEGQVREVGGQIDPKTRFVNVRVAFKGGDWLPGTRVRGDIVVDSHKAQAVPRQAVLRDDRGAYLFQVDGGKAHRIAVRTGLDDGVRVEVLTPVLRDLPVVTLGNYELEDGMAVREHSQ